MCSSDLCISTANTRTRGTGHHRRWIHCHRYRLRSPRAGSRCGSWGNCVDNRLGGRGRVGKGVIDCRRSLRGGTLPRCIGIISGYPRVRRCHIAGKGNINCISTANSCRRGAGHYRSRIYSHRNRLGCSCTSPGVRCWCNCIDYRLGNGCGIGDCIVNSGGGLCGRALPCGAGIVIAYPGITRGHVACQTNV